MENEYENDNITYDSLDTFHEQQSISKYKKKSLIYSWRVKAMLNYLKSMTLNDECGKKDINKVIDNYLRFVDEKIDAQVIRTFNE